MGAELPLLVGAEYESRPAGGIHGFLASRRVANVGFLRHLSPYKWQMNSHYSLFN